MTTPASNIHVLEPRSSEPGGAPPSRLGLWKQRILLVIEVLFFIELGMMLLVLPWTHVWTENSILNSSFQIRQVAESGFLRGTLSGLGLVNLWIAVWDAVRYRE